MHFNWNTLFATYGLYSIRDHDRPIDHYFLRYVLSDQPALYTRLVSLDENSEHGGRQNHQGGQIDPKLGPRIVFCFLWCISIVLMGFGLFHLKTAPSNISYWSSVPYACFLYLGFLGAMVCLFSFLATWQ